MSRKVKPEGKADQGKTRRPSPKKKRSNNPGKTGDNTVPPPESTGKLQGRPDEATRFQPGQSGNPAGRPPGSRNKFCKAMLNDFATVWREADEEGRPGGLVALRKVRDDKPDAFVRAAMQWVPQEFELGDNANGAFRQIWEALAAGKVPKPPSEDETDDD